jgi:anaerobic ribonucleoside-triphosphate reductase activating protein
MRLSPEVNKDDFDYIKIGPYLQHLGPLNKPTTNQRLYKNTHNDAWEDITSRFWKK